MAFRLLGILMTANPVMTCPNAGLEIIIAPRLRMRACLVDVPDSGGEATESVDVIDLTVDVAETQELDDIYGKASRRLLSQVADLDSRDDELCWETICALLLHDPEDKEGCLRLSGARTEMFIHQAISIGRFPRDIRRDLVNGLLCANPPGLGKTLESIAIMVIITIADLSQKHWEGLCGNYNKTIELWYSADAARSGQSWCLELATERVKM